MGPSHHHLHRKPPSASLLCRVTADSNRPTYLRTRGQPTFSAVFVYSGPGSGLLKKFSRSLEKSLQDYSSKGGKDADRVEGRIRDVAYRVQDVIETEISNQIASEKLTHVTKKISHRPKISIKQKVFAELFSDVKSVFCREGEPLECVVDLPKVEQEIASIVDEMAAVKKRQRSEGSLLDYNSIEVGGCEQANASRDAIVGFDEYLIAIKDQLCGHSTNLQIIPIVGMGGIGKTTLARTAFNDSLISYHFYCRGWTTVSQGYSLERVLKTILKSLTGMSIDMREGEEKGALMERIHKSLSGQRYLIVLDDVWSQEFWVDIKRIFPDQGNGSRILITTRLLDLARSVAGSSGFIHEMQFLNVEASWNLLRKKVFAQEYCAPQLEDIGRIIASKCGGLPLAIVVIAGVLSNVRTPQYWEKVAKNVGSILRKDAENLSNIVSLSFNHLPHQLRACFLYMGSLPEYSEVAVTRLTSLWTAEGLLRSIDGSKTSEQVGDECLGDLVKRNLVIVTKRRANGQFKYCTIHDLLRDFCRDRALQECFFHGIYWERYLSNPRVENVRRIIPYSYPYVAWTIGTMFGTLSKQPCSFHTCKFVRSILLFDRTYVTENTWAFKWDNFKLLKVLDIAYVHRHLAPLGLSSMFLLKHLTLDVLAIHNQFASIFKLPCLESLILYGSKYCCGLLPSEFWKAPRLRCLTAFVEIKLPPAPLTGGVVVHKLEYLQTLETVKDFIFTKEAIEMIPNLRKLKTEHTEFIVKDKWKHYCLNNLVHLYQLEELKIMFSQVESFPSSVAFPLNLKKLSLSGCRLSWKELTVAGSLPCLQILRLKDKAFVGEEWEAVEGEFLQLKFLLLEGLDLKYWSADSTHFPCLEHLKIIRCYYLSEIPSEIGDIPTLKSITVHESRLAEVSAEQILKEQRDYGNDDLQVLVTYIRYNNDLASRSGSNSTYPLRIDEWIYDKAIPRATTQKGLVRLHSENGNENQSTGLFAGLLLSLMLFVTGLYFVEVSCGVHRI